MLVPVRWLLELCPFSGTVEELAELLTRKGVHVEGVKRLSDGLEQVEVGEVVAAASGKVEVKLGKGKLTFAAGLAVGDRVLVGPKGTRLADGTVLAESRLLLEKELGLGLEGPARLSSVVPAGTKLFDIVDDHVLELEVLPNRGDLLGMIGVARELAAHTGAKFTYAIPDVKEGDRPIEQLARLEVREPSACPRYLGRLVYDVRVEPSRFELRWRLAACGMRAVNNIVDITNYILHKYGQPLHAFDFDRLGGGAVVVRFASPGEKILTIEDQTHDLDPTMLVIADERRPVAIAGIMGGKLTEISPGTRTVFLESACFDPAVIRGTTQKLKLTSDSSQRFEFGVDIEHLTEAAREATALMAQYGTVAAGLLDRYRPRPAREVVFERSRAERILGTGVGAVTPMLEPLGFRVREDGDRVSVGVPSFRPDVERDVDIYEELARLIGYEQVTGRFRLAGAAVGGRSPRSVIETRVRRAFIRQGFREAKTMSFTDAARSARCFPGPLVKLLNPLSERFDTLRPSLLPGLFDTVGHNQRRGNADLRLVEVGKVFRPDRETSAVAGVIAGMNEPLFWRERERAADFFDLKGALETFLGAWGIEELIFAPVTNPLLDPSRAASIASGSQVLGFVGQLAPAVIETYDLLPPVHVFELDLDELVAVAPGYRVYAPLAKYPPVTRDLSFIVDAKLPAGELASLVRRSVGALLDGLVVFDCFSGAPLPPGRKNIGLRLTLRAEDRTLEQKEIDKLVRHLAGLLTRKLGAELRTQGG